MAENRNYARLLAVTDGSDPSLRAGEHTVNLAKNLGAELFVLRVVNKHLVFRSGLFDLDEGRPRVTSSAPLCQR